MANINQHRIAVGSICTAVLVSTLAAHAAALPPDPNNAALLYYQALLRRPEPDDAAKILVYDATREQIYKLLLGGEFETDDLYWSYDDPTDPAEKLDDINPNEKIREYLKECKETIEYAEAAGRLSQSNWGFWYSQGYGPGTEVMMQWESLMRVLSVDALILAADKDYRAALERCLTIRQLARHIPHDTEFCYMKSVDADGRALRAIRHILGITRLDVDTLTWLKTQLASKSAMPQSPVRMMKMNLELMLQTIRTDDKGLAWLRVQLALKNLQDMIVKKDIRHLSEDDLLARIGKPYAEFLDSAVETIQSDLPYEYKYGKLQKLVDTFQKEAKGNPTIIRSMEISAGAMLGSYYYHLRHAADFNALRTAIEIYLVRAKTGRLPDTLPAGSLKDPYSDKAFEYERTKEGFVLRCRVKEIALGKAQQYEFKVQE